MKRHPKFGLRTLLMAVSVVSVPLAVLAWYNAPAQKVPRLLDELADRPGGHIDLAWSGRPTAEIEADFKAMGAAAVPFLVEALRSEDPSIRRLAAGQLGRLKDSRAVEPLIGRLRNDSDEIVRTWTASALGDIGDRRAVEPLLDFIDEPKGSKRWVAIEALGKIGGPAATAPILQFLDDEDIYTRAYAAEALGRLDHAMALEPLIHVLESGDDPWVRDMAAASLGQMASPKAIAALRAARQDSSLKVTKRPESP